MDQFLNRLRMLYNIDRYELSEAPLSDKEWEGFRTYPTAFLITASPAFQEAIWRIIEAREARAK